MAYFKNIVLGIFIVGAIVGVLMFGGIIKIGGNAPAATEIKGTVVIWGTFSQQAMTPFLADYRLANVNIHVNYVEKDSATFSNSLVEAIASGTPPDLVILPDNLINRFKDKVTHISFLSIPADTFTNTYISAANIFTAKDGIIALPWATDPVIMYYNRDMLQSAGIANPPKNWQEFTDSIKLLTIKQSNLTITQSAAALGTYANIAHVKDILALLFMQTGNPFMAYDYIRFTAYFGGGMTPNESNIANQVMSFYSAFADPVKSVYTWNAGQPLDRDMFTQSALAYYFGSASELPAIRAKNPNLNFGIALPPQSVTGNILTSGRIYGFAIPKTAPNQLVSYTAATLLSNAAAETSLSGNSAVTLSLIPVRRDVLANKQISDQYLNFLYKTALVQKSWFDPDPVASDQILGSMIKNINSSLLDIGSALGKAESQLETTAIKQ
jgi:ABC-type glycerol-3-phosphate transport system substrate-binding protein